MKRLYQRNGITYGLLERGDANRQLACQIMEVHFCALSARYPQVDPRAIKACQRSDVSNDNHIEDTIENLSEPNWYWVVAGRSGTVGAFSVYWPGGTSVHLAELHTHPKLMGRKLASTNLLLGLEYAKRTWEMTNVTLGVDIAGSHDAFPYQWYRKLGFANCGLRRTYKLGTLTLRKFDMEASLQTVCLRLRRSLAL